MAKEIERKFLLAEFPRDLNPESQQELMQGYLQLDDHKDLRIRKSPKGFTLTAKVGVGLVREENEHGISEAMFNTLWPFTENKRISKVRHRVLLNNQPCDIDVYRGSLDGLIVMETEFDSESDAERFSFPDFCVKEITGDHSYRNAELAQFGMPQN